ncbi:DUF2798 domain-containing protein [Acinetobacter rongchengensis]|uniref:DUF2798 domain-containing protein n=1 Tax=Acinetobacter rongchengensis TaxID=2419601 RepID=A0A3A8ESW9_9GAMM|nr:DUF2798 domain-containing protein [Acinetobacter rongchengensis]RKG37952.1 DUF2798 domain-containing protein [Acinetobacter rongchengensis]
MQKNPSMIIGNIPKLPAKHAAWILPLILSCLMSAAISMFNLWKNLGLVDGFFSKWLSVWLLSWAIAYPTVLIFLPIVRRLTGLIVDLTPPEIPK